MCEENRLYNLKNTYYAKRGFKDSIIAICQLGWKTSEIAFDLEARTKENVVNILSDIYSFDKEKILLFIDENIMIGA